MSHTKKLYELLSDGQPHRTDQILREVYGGDHLGISRIGARIYDLKRKYHIEIVGRKDTVNPSLYWYQIVNNRPSVLDSLNQESERMRAENENRKRLETLQPKLL